MIQRGIYASVSTHYKIGIAFSYTNKYDRSTQQILNGIHVAKLLLEKKYPHHQVDLIRYTYKSNDLQSVARAANQICKDKISVVIGGEMSEEALIMGGILNSCHVVLVSPTATNPLVSKDRAYVFRVSASDDDVAAKLAQYVSNLSKTQIIGVVDNVSLPYSDYLSKKFITEYLRLTRHTPLVKKVLREHVDYSSEIDEFIKNNVNVVVILSYDIDLERFVFQASQKKYFPIYIGSDGWGSNESLVRKICGNKLYGKKFVAFRNDYWRSYIDNELSVQFKNLYNFHYHSKPDAWNAIGFDSAWLVFKVMLSEHGDVGSDSLRNKILNIHNFQLLTTNNFEFKSNNAPVKDFYIYKISSNGSKNVATLRGIG